MTPYQKSIRKIITFLVITFGLSIIFYSIIIKTGSIQTGGGLFTLALMWMPGLSGMITQLIFEKNLRGMGWKFGKAKYLLLGYLIPLIYSLVVYSITWISGLGGVPNPAFIADIQQGFNVTGSATTIYVLLYILEMATFGIVMGLLSGAGEEIGWRGLFVPELAKVTSFAKTTLISGVVWTIWHMPLIMFADYNLPGVPKWFSILMFTIMVLGINTVFSWLCLKSKSWWPAAMMHASHNVFVQSVFTPLTTQGKITPFIIDEFGIGLALAGIVIAVIFLRKGKDLGLQVN
ncbi:MAG: CPBP family intramembrane metalloprotease domain-containing protein [Chloroflexi bacterium HGW-Chloroflexi-4]|jgi:membrane protease YdiL (CAAX protease family)|nr:MAG: CPBP family intramembrane metalloprotease domain-containing protein [Chloroflexi bacterium HGW-Chloroflexi-4]